MGRHSAIENEQRLFSPEIRTDINQIAFLDLMQASSGMLEPKELNSYLLGNVGVNGTEAFFYTSRK